MKRVCVYQKQKKSVFDVERCSFMPWINIMKLFWVNVILQFIMRCLQQMHIAHDVFEQTNNGWWPLHIKLRRMYDQRVDLSFFFVWNIYIYILCIAIVRYLFVIFHPFDSYTCTLHCTLYTYVQYFMHVHFRQISAQPLFCGSRAIMEKTMDKCRTITKMKKNIFHKEDLLAAKRRNQTCLKYFCCCGRWI